jgi:RNA polymerase sigma-70 factor (ECF subfamily)
MHTELDDIIQNSAVFSQPAKQTDVFMAEIINQAIAELPVEFREALVLREYDHFSYSEIAEILGIDLSLAKVRVHRARLSLRKKLSPIVHDHYDA